MEDIIRIIHPIDTEDSFQAAFVETGVVCHKGKPVYEGRGLFPDKREDRRPVRIFGSESVNLAAEPLAVVRLGMDQAIVGIDNLPAADHHYSHAAHAGRLLVGRLKVLCWGDSYVGWPL